MNKDSILPETPELAQKGIILSLQPRPIGYAMEDVRHASRDAITPGEVPCVSPAQAFPVHALDGSVMVVRLTRSTGVCPGNRKPPEERDGGFECERPCGRSFSTFGVW